MRIVKDPEERKSEILDTAEMLFCTKGYSKTTVNDILNEVGIAKGTFYYYFKSKEEVMDAIITRIIDNDINIAKKIALNPEIPVLEKFFQILMSQRPKVGDNKEKVIQQFHLPNNAEMHQKTIVKTILNFTPILAEVVEEGVREGIFNTKYPKETIEFLIASSECIFDESMFSWNKDEMLQKKKAFVHIMEITLGADKGSFDFVHDMIIGN
ncbi:TetR/AcrR family transcriptional regulator [Clostridioides sp. ZZV14-6345]|uniref:TetR/AcrR family transcriptional regulator n=1 Tax=Clostridioides sp. ZZV14-6345 TaxID=2811496 RepID=UPI001D0FE3EC|nr:TetR/AcrR family transcriptional regulator [Clostridioides sp. ZZV14-6345]